MSGITDPTEEYFKDGLWGWVTSAWVKLVATAGGLLKIQIGGQDADVTVKQTTPADLTPGICGWDGTAWRKNPILIGFSAKAGEYLESLSLAAGTNYLTGAAVPAGKVWVVTNIAMYYYGTVPGAIDAMIVRGGVSYYIYRQFSPVSGAFYDRQVNLIMTESDYLRMIIHGATLNDDASISWLGFEMGIT